MDFDYKVVIPARYGSTRLPAKPLKKIAGKPMIQWVCENAKKARAGEVIAAVDDERIVAAVEAFGGRAMMTSDQHRSGTDRIAEVAEKLGWSDDTIVVNLQGDEPRVGADVVRRVAVALHEHPEAGVATLAAPIDHVDDFYNPNVVKVVVDGQGLALYFSRAPIPWVRDEMKQIDQPLSILPAGIPFLRHVGLYAYRVGDLCRIAAAEPADIERAESLEQLRAMAMGIRIFVDVVAEAPGHGVDTEEDLRRVEEMFSSEERQR